MIMFDEIDGLLRKRTSGDNWSDKDNAALVGTFNTYSDKMIKKRKCVLDLWFSRKSLMLGSNKLII